MSSNTPTALIFGGSGGIGRALVKRLKSRGWNVTVAARDAGRFQAVTDDFGATTIATDVTKPAEVDAAVASVLETSGRLDAVAHCVGSIVLKPIHLTTDAEWDDVIRINLTSAFHVVRASVKAMPSGGSIALVSSVAARVGLINHEAIAAAKAGVIGMTLSAAATYASKGIRINCVAPGLVRTPLAARLTGSEAALKASTAMHPLGRIGEPDDVAAALEYFLNPENSWITGQVLGTDGGLATLRGR